MNKGIHGIFGIEKRKKARLFLVIFLINMSGATDCAHLRELVDPHVQTDT